MDLNGQNDISIALKAIKVVIVFVLIIFMFIVPDNNTYASTNEFQLKDINITMDEKIINKEKAKDESDIDEKASTAHVFSSNVNNIFNINLKGNSIRLCDNTVSLFSLVEDKYTILEQICNSYVNELGLDAKNIIQIEVLGVINSNLDKDRIATLKSSGEISGEIYNATVIKDNLEGLKLKVNLMENTIVEPKTVVEKSDDLFMGESTTIEGVEGKNILYKEITYDGLSKSEEKIVDEEIIEPTVDTIVKVGTKNPYYAGVAFLSRPTKGGYLSSSFGEVRSTSVHKGIDIAKNLGESVNASLDGRVIKAEYNNGGYGNLIVLEHENNMKTYYAHLSEIYVKKGDIIKKDDIIGAIGNTGNSTGPHLHFELRVNDKPVDPIKYIEK
ncbi:peptidoglycan DD-metalloendopeptidase family protein [Clostridioides difficile]